MNYFPGNRSPYCYPRTWVQTTDSASDSVGDVWRWCRICRLWNLVSLAQDTISPWKTIASCEFWDLVLEFWMSLKYSNILLTLIHFLMTQRHKHTWIRAPRQALTMRHSPVLCPCTRGSVHTLPVYSQRILSSVYVIKTKVKKKLKIKMKDSVFKKNE